MMTIHKVVTDQDIGDGLRIANGKLEAIAQPSSSLDLDNLPTVAWKKGTGILVKQDGALKQMQPLENIFQEIGVGITANKLSGLTNEKYHVVVTVTNTGEGVNDQTDLVITTPQLGTYTTTNFTTSKAGAEITRGSDDFHYTITHLRKGGTVKVEFDVTPSGTGTYQFTASVNPNSALDQQSNNNTATIILSATMPAQAEDASYTPTVECPAVVVKYQGQPLYMGLDAVNVFGELTTLQGITLETENVGTIAVIVSKQGEEVEKGYSRSIFNGRRYYHAILKKDKSRIGTVMNLMSLKSNTSNPVNANNYITTDKFTSFNSNVISVTGDVQSLVIALRPLGSDCKWQYIVLYAMSTMTTNITSCIQSVSGNSLPVKGVNYANTHLAGNRNIYDLTNYPFKQLYLSELVDIVEVADEYESFLASNRVNLIGDKSQFTLYKSGYEVGAGSFYPLTPNAVYQEGKAGNRIKEISIKPGETITVTGCEVPAVVSQGRLQCSYSNGTLTIVASPDATDADFIRSDNGELTIRVVV